MLAFFASIIGALSKASLQVIANSEKCPHAGMHCRTWDRITKEIVRGFFQSTKHICLYLNLKNEEEENLYMSILY